MASRLDYQISETEKIIKLKKDAGKDASFEKALIKEWKNYLHGGTKHHLWQRHSGETEENGCH